MTEYDVNQLLELKQDVLQRRRNADVNDLSIIIYLYINMIICCSYLSLFSLHLVCN